MKHIFVNLKRFDVPRHMGGICPKDHPVEWIEEVMDQCVSLELGTMKGINLTFLLPEALVLPAIKRLKAYPETVRTSLQIGVQGVYREDVRKGGNFGAFTTNLPAAAVKNMNCEWIIIGHSEERKDKLSIIGEYDPESLTAGDKRKSAKAAVDRMINQEVLRSLENGIKALLCVGETTEEKEGAETREGKLWIDAIISQIDINLEGTEAFHPQDNIVIGYEPIWAIGPGKTPPGKDYIGPVSEMIKGHCRQKFNFDPVVVYGGGLKEENAGMISSIETIGGGLVALTKFSGEIGFYPEDLKKIIQQYK